MAKQTEKKNHSSKPSPKPENTLARLSSITFELLTLNLGIIGIGYLLDKKFGGGIPWFLIASIFFSVAATIYYLLKKFVN
ncbi:AtpZ/AtpI family protein [Marinoscillum furvescens]|uniref:Putative F0F1-ATPase subunit (Ca2+/Mg2+ transporter) n=1 Tax=Marinoscillum furvescens DSM 4134 TaxID=1122208 RepID=A0A3D9L4H0_MARFU|nr:putative F0F1-ATPase subunit (Ca2+/Mg2+ transporter) [Marinoscillum furvescens DSM 4134]